MVVIGFFSKTLWYTSIDSILTPIISFGILMDYLHTINQLDRINSKIKFFGILIV